MTATLGHLTSERMRTFTPDATQQEHQISEAGTEIPSLELSVTRYFGSADLDRAGLVSGWAEPEEAHNWSDGCETVLTVVISNPGHGCVIEFSGEPFFNERSQRQDVILHVNGFQVGRWRLTSPGDCELSVRVEPEQLFQRGGSMLLRCSWSFPDSISPAALGMSDDSRELGFCFRSITISKT